VLEVFRTCGLEVRPGIMSTVVIGDTDAVFDGLKASFQSASALGDVVMVALKVRRTSVTKVASAW
jgi:hypothetical protein